eukprot:3144063-Pyramimonas_sp.AAC.1
MWNGRDFLGPFAEENKNKTLHVWFPSVLASLPASPRLSPPLTDVLSARPLSIGLCTSAPASASAVGAPWSAFGPAHPSRFSPIS